MKNITIKGRLQDIDLEYVSEINGYFPGQHYTDYIYKNEKFKQYFIQRIFISDDEELSMDKKDWDIIPVEWIDIMYNDMNKVI